MIVKNIAVSDRKFFTEWLVRDLIQHQISYVQIENEFHFLEYIFRFYDMNEDKEQIIKLSGIGNVFDEITVVPSLFEIEEKDPFLGVTVAEGRGVSGFPVKQHSKPNMKKMIKRQNRMVNQKLSQIKR